jgi:hypothetical protein
MSEENFVRHGWVTPLASGSKARCGGPDFCEDCRKELHALEMEKRAMKRIEEYIKKVDEMDLKRAVEVLKEGMRKDPEYRDGWKSNIAVCFYDHARNTQPKFITDLWTQKQFSIFANEAAESFIDHFLKTHS